MYIEYHKLQNILMNLSLIHKLYHANYYLDIFQQ